MLQISFDISTINLPKNIILADSTPNESKPIDILLGAGVFFDILCVGQIKTNASNPIIQKTKQGWVVSGHLNVENYDTRISCNIAISNNELYEQLQAFWKIEDVKTKTHYTLEELECEEHYAKTFRRDDQGRFEVTLPVKDELNPLGESEKGAITRFFSIEKRFIRDSEYERAKLLAAGTDVNKLSIVIFFPDIERGKHILFTTSVVAFLTANEPTRCVPQ
ncbi:hypothetical protein JTB14_019305 [Gonioctena quinquepunctata]|nr:hypothetical protein JTB14_019305 [Gonioctena quinquepunctata]